MVDPDATYVDATVELGRRRDHLPGGDPPGPHVVGRGSEVGPGTRLVDCIVGTDAVLDRVTGHDAEIGSGAIVGPYAVLSPGASIPDGTVTGPFYTATGAE